jgi:hypothetical protein
MVASLTAPMATIPTETYHRVVYTYRRLLSEIQQNRTCSFVLTTRGTVVIIFPADKSVFVFFRHDRRVFHCFGSSVVSVFGSFADGHETTQKLTRSFELPQLPQIPQLFRAPSNGSLLSRYPPW